MNDIYNTFSERFLKVQLVFEPPPPPPPVVTGRPDGGKPKKRYNALGILEDIVEEESTNGASQTGTDAVIDVGPDMPPKKDPVARKDPVVVGAGRARSLESKNPPANVDWSSVGRNDPCPCGSGKKFKKCHGATV